MRASRSAVLALVVVVTLSSVAAAEPVDEVRHEPTGPSFAFATGSVQNWLVGTLGVSGYVAVAPHHALRANVARYNRPSALAAVADGFSDDGSGDTGKITDAGVGWVWYPQRLWDGVTVEAGVVLRGRSSVYWPEFDGRTETHSTSYAGRLMVGWSWLMGRHLFIAVAAGASAGRERGRETVTPDSSTKMPTTTAFDRRQVEAETYVRFGFTTGG
jgi:hypothetical protein